MTRITDSSAAFTLLLTEDERAHLLNWLEQRRRNTLVEEHRTKTLTYKKFIRQEERVLDNLIAKLQRASAS